MDKELKLCPFCGNKAEIVICDDEGNLRDKAYEEDPYSGLKYMIFHDVKTAEDCPVSHIEIENAIWMYDTREEAIDAWNTRVKYEFDDYLNEVYDWAFSGLEGLKGCNKPEWTLLFNIANIISDYRVSINKKKEQS